MTRCTVLELCAATLLLISCVAGQAPSPSLTQISDRKTRAGLVNAQVSCRTPRSPAAPSGSFTPIRSPRTRSRSPNSGRRQRPATLAEEVREALNSGDIARAAEVLLDAESRQDLRANADQAASIVVNECRENPEDMARAMVGASRRDVGTAARLLARAARVASRRGEVESFADSQSQALAVARRAQFLDIYSQTISQAIAQGGGEAKSAYALAFSQAMARGGDQALGLAQATAIVFCTGGSTMEAYAEAFASSVSQQSDYCSVVTETRAYAYARCGPGGAEAWTDSASVSRIMGDCSLSPDVEVPLLP